MSALAAALGFIAGVIVGAIAVIVVTANLLFGPSQ